MRSRRPSSRRAFSLVEAALSVIIVGGMFTVALAMMGAAARDRGSQSELRTARALATMLMSEIQQQRYQQRDGVADVSTPSPRTFDDVDDYNNFIETPPLDRTGAIIPGTLGWTWRAVVTNFAVPDLTPLAASVPDTNLVNRVNGPVALDLVVPNAAPATDTGLKIIQVTVSSPRGRPYTLTALRSRWGTPDTVASRPYWSYADVNITVGDAARRLQVSTPLLNQPEK